jgi:hypothetical protein
VFGFYFLKVQSVIKLTLRVLGLVKHHYRKHLLIAHMEKILSSKKVGFYRGIQT